MKYPSTVLNHGPAVLDFGPDPSVVRQLAAPFEPTCYAYFALGSAADLAGREIRWRHLAERLRSTGAAEAAVELIGQRIAAAPASPASSLAVFTSARGGPVAEYTLGDLVVEDQAAMSFPPVLLPLLAWRQGRPPHLAATIDRTGADLASCAGPTEPVEHLSITGTDDEIERNAPGGWSQPRYQQRAEDSWRHNAGQVAEAIDRLIDRTGAQVLLLSGDGRSVQLLRERLSHRTDLLIEELTGSRSPDGSQPHRPQRIMQALGTAAAMQNALVLQRLHTHLDSDGLAVQGMRDTIQALATGRVAMLVVGDDPSAEATAWFGAGPTEIYLTEAHARRSGNPVVEGPLAEVAVRAALLTGARVRVLPAESPGLPAGGIGALCRYGRSLPNPS